MGIYLATISWSKEFSFVPWLPSTQEVSDVFWRKVGQRGSLWRDFSKLELQNLQHLLRIRYSNLQNLREREREVVQFTHHAWFPEPGYSSGSRFLKHGLISQHQEDVPLFLNQVHLQKGPHAKSTQASETSSPHGFRIAHTHAHIEHLNFRFEISIVCSS